jgi:hypothetical protein
LLELGSNHRCDDGNVRSVCQQASQFPRGHTTTANKKNPAVAKLQEYWMHSVSLCSNF